MAEPVPTGAVYGPIDLYFLNGYYEPRLSFFCDSQVMSMDCHELRRLFGEQALYIAFGEKDANIAESIRIKENYRVYFHSFGLMHRRSVIVFSVIGHLSLRYFFQYVSFFTGLQCYRFFIDRAMGGVITYRCFQTESG